MLANVQRALGGTLTQSSNESGQSTSQSLSFVGRAGVASTQTLVVDGFDIYSPEPVIFNGVPRLYFGGWLSSNDLPHDAIYVADCPYGAGACTNARKVIDAVASGVYQLNDPSIVLVRGNGSTRDYYIMYMTGSTDTTIASNNIYYSVSWADDGVNSPYLGALHRSVLIFAAYSEEWGFVGITLVFALYGVIFWRLLRAAQLGASNFETLFIIGVLCYLAAHFVLHVGINMGVLPVTVTTIPFMSYGGSHILVEFLTLGIVSAMGAYSRVAHRDAMDREFSGGYDN